MQFKRDKHVCLERLVTLKDGGVSNRMPCRIHIPKRWMNVGLGTMTDVTTVYGFFPIIFDDDVYTVLNVCALLDVLPSRTTVITINEEEYYEFHFDANVRMIKTLNLVRQDTLTFDVLNEFIMKGKVPWWGGLADLCSIFDTADKHAGSKIAKIPQVIEFLVGVTARRIEERSKMLRHTANSWDDFDLNKIEFIPMMSVLDLNSTLAKLSGSFFADGVISSIVNPASKTGKIESILRA